MVRKLEGPSLLPKSGIVKNLVVFLHGYGADGDDLIGLGRNWAGILPNSAFISPHAPEPCGMSDFGRQWWALTFRDPDERWRGCQKAAPDLVAFLDEELDKYKLEHSQLALVGFSQGAMMALHVGLRLEKPPAAIIAYSGHLVGAEHLSADIKSKPPVFLAHGDRDEVIPIKALYDSVEALKSVNVPFEQHVSIGVGHGIDGDALDLGGKFIAKNLSF